MFNTIILLHGDAVLSKMEMKKFKKGDTVINDWADEYCECNGKG